MNSKFFTFFKRKRVFLSVTLVGAIAVTGVMMKATSSKRAELSGVSEGIQTCFIRANQTYTAKLLGQGNLEYLGTPFMAATEECFSEALGTLKSKYAADVKNAIRALNATTTEIHSFHQKLKETSAEATAVSTLFSKVETLKDETLEEIAVENETLSFDFQKFKGLFFLFCGLFPLLAFWEIIERRRSENRLRAIENEALAELQGGNLHQDNRIEALIKTALQFGEMTNCARLFEQWNNHHALAVKPVVFEKTEVPVETVEEVVTTPLHVKDVAIEPLLAKVIDQLSSRIFTAGIMLELDVSEDLRVLGREDVVEQIFFHAIVRSVNSLSEKTGTRRLTLSAKTLGAHTTFEVTDNGQAFSTHEMDVQAGLSKESRDIELLLCREMSSELGGTVTIENVIHEDEIRGTKLKIRFASGEGAKRLVSLKRGKKKDLMREMSF